jgi:L-asparaginase
MPEVFISYAHADNQPNPYVNDLVDKPVERFREVYLYLLKQKAIPTEDYFYFDEGEPPGENILDSVRDAIASCTVMLAFFSPNYFNSKLCFQEYREFVKGREEERTATGRARKLLIPMELVELPDGFTSTLDDPEVDGWIRELTTSNGSRYGARSSQLLDPSSRPLREHIDPLLMKTIGERIQSARHVSPGHESADNLLVVEAPIVQYTLKNNSQIARTLERKDQMKYSTIGPVSVVYAGGTVGMVHQAGSDPIHSDFEMAHTVEDIVSRLRPTFKDLPFNIHFFRLDETIDSSNVRAKTWVALAGLTRELLNGGYQGVVFLHGTNTICYTASALSFLLNDTIDAPVILTGSEIPISVNNTDAVHNIENAVRAAAHEAYNGPIVIPEVCIYWSNQLLRGNRTTKRVASDRQSSFHTPNLALPLASLAHEKLDVEHTLVRRLGADASHGPSSTSELPDLSAVRVEVMFIYPEMQFDNLMERYPDSIDGLILLSYGSGNVPEDERFIRMIRRLVEAGCIVVNITQCPFGRVELKLFETSAILFDLGVIDGYDMTLECAYTKLLWALASVENRRQPGARDSIRKKFQVSVAGEMSASIHRLDFGGTGKEFTPFKGGPFLLSDMMGPLHLDRYDIVEAYLRIDGARPRRADQDLDLSIYFGPPPGITDSEGDIYAQSMLARFRRRMTLAEQQQGSFSKNLDVTHAFRKNFRKGEFQLSVGSSDGVALQFDGLSLIVYSRAN